MHWLRNTVYLSVFLDLCIIMHAFEAKKSIFDISIVIKSYFYSKKCNFCELVAAVCDILQAISWNMKFDLSPIATSILLVKYYFKIIQFKLETNIVPLFKFLKCRTIRIKKTCKKSFTRKYFLPQSAHMG